jgi:hypothetical protein
LPDRLCTAPPDIVISDAVRIATSSVVASDAEITAAWLTSSAVIVIGLVLSELQAAAKTSANIGAPTSNLRFIRKSLVEVERARRCRVRKERGNGTATTGLSATAHRPFDVRGVLVVT